MSTQPVTSTTEKTEEPEIIQRLRDAAENHPLTGMGYSASVFLQNFPKANLLSYNITNHSSLFYCQSYQFVAVVDQYCNGMLTNPATQFGTPVFVTPTETTMDAEGNHVMCTHHLLGPAGLVATVRQKTCTDSIADPNAQTVWGVVFLPKPPYTRINVDVR